MPDKLWRRKRSNHRLFVNDMLAEHPNLTFANREEDLGDPGLRQVKRAYNPVMMIDRYEMRAEQHCQEAHHIL